MRKLSVLIILILLSFNLTAQDEWSVGEEKLQLNGEEVFLNGVNYIPSDQWMMILKNWNPKVFENDLKHLKDIGVDYIRFCPPWSMTQPDPDHLNEEIFKRIDHLFDVAEKEDIKIQLAPITGWLSGATFLPQWADGNIYTDPEILEGQVTLLSGIAERYKDHPALFGYDFGNETNVIKEVMKLDLSPADVKSWMEKLYQAYKSEDKKHLVTNGIGTGFNQHFNIWSIEETSDYMSIHSYPYFHGTWEMDPWLGFRTSYSSNYITEWAAMTGKPVLIQEIGASEDWMNKHLIARYLKVNYFSNWADGATGFWWWDSHNIDRDFKLFDEGIYLDYSIENFREGNFHPLEYELGLLNTQNQVKPVGMSFQECTKIQKELGMGWKDLLPVVYILIPENSEYAETMMNFITPYVIGKQIHMDVKLWPENKQVPGDADALIVSNFSLSSAGKKNVASFLDIGGTVLQSYYKDFGNPIANDKIISANDPQFEVVKREGMMALGEKIRARGNLKIRSLDESNDEESLLALETDQEDNPHPILTKTEIGKGNYYYLASNWEATLKDIYNPWENDDSNLAFSVIRPDYPFFLENKYVELYHKEKEGKHLLVLINHSDQFQEAVLNATDSYQYYDYITKEKVNRGAAIPVQLKPGAVLFLSYEKLKADEI